MSKGQMREPTKKPEIDIAAVAAISFQALPSASDLASRWQESNREMIVHVSCAAHILTLTPSKLRSLVSDVGINEWLTLLDGLRSGIDNAKGLLAVLDAAHSRGLIALAAFAEPPAVNATAGQGVAP